MELQIEIRNLVKCSNGSTRIGFVYYGDEAYSESEKFKGISEQEYFINKDIFDEISLFDMKNKIWTIKIEEKPYANNPLKSRKMITELKTDNVCISLL